MKHILYISYVLPSVTTTFVYREIQALEKAGYFIDTLSMNRPEQGDVHSEAISIYQRTTYLDQIHFIKKILAQIVVFARKPMVFFSSLCIALMEKERNGLRDRVRLLWHFLEAGYLYCYYKNEEIDQIHASFLNGPASLAFFLSRYLAIPFSFTIHASNIFIDPIMLGRKLETAKKIVTISKYNKDFLLQKYGESLDWKIHVIHCGINVTKFHQVSRKQNERPVILSVGQLTERKGFIFLLEACSLLKNKGIDFSCNIVGDGEDKEKLMEAARSLDIEDIVSFLGKRLQDEVQNFLQQATVFCLPSIITQDGGREGIPVAIMEAMAMELPVISTDTVGIPELVTHNEEGLLVSQKDSKALAGAIERLFQDTEKRKAMGIAARKKVREQFNVQNIPKDFEVIFN